MHHAVFREDKATTKKRVVLDGIARSAKFDYSINHCLSKGPNLLVSLFEILLRFRLFKVTVLADIEKAFLQVCIDQDDIDSLRILWYDDALQQTRNVGVFRYLMVVFEFVCSPFRGALDDPPTIRVQLKRWLEQAVTEEDRCGLKRLLESFYVDDLTLSVPSDNEAEKLVSISVKVMKDAVMSLRKWVTNSSGVYNRLA